jgi:hypothetical protein
MKNSLSLIMLLLSISSVSACPYCGCGNSNFQLGVLPTYSNAFFGIRYTYSHFKTDSGSQYSRDYFHTTELWGGYKVGKVMVMAFVPFISIHKLSDDGDINARGLGDITILGNYMVYSKTRPGSDTKKILISVFWVGGGIKFHTGQSLVDINDPGFTVGDFSQTPGTGSTDFLLNVNHNLTYGKNGVVTNLAYRINTTNAQQFRYGNRVYATVNYYHSFSVGSFLIRPTVGASLVVNGTNHFQDAPVIGSSGYILVGMAGVNVQRGKVGIMMNGGLPVAEDLYHGLTQFKERASVALTYSF